MRELCDGLGGSVAAAHRRGGGGCHGPQASGGLRPHEEEGEELPPAQAAHAGEVKTWITAKGEGMCWRFEMVAGCRVVMDFEGNERFLVSICCPGGMEFRDCFVCCFN